ncbi:MAG TPA: PQQ-binding-like beta-propeller repeat protein [Gemmataceae bacterium]|nr:PQQ-binding-like beta-propeller repeat protein [Gemmataceae bacterium]
MRFVIALALTLGLVSLASAADWPQWLGANRNGSTTEKVAPWKGDLKKVWHIAVGEGHSSPIVAGGLVYLHTKIEKKDAELVQAFDAKTGEMKWEQSYERPKFSTLFGDGPRATPCVHDGKLYTFGITGTLACWEAATGNPQWKTDVLDDAKKENLYFGVSASPLVVGDYVVIQGGNGSAKGLKAFDRKSGKLAWTAGTDAPSYAAPVVFGREIVALTGDHLKAISQFGELIWEYPFGDKLAGNSTTPIKVGDLYIAASVRAGAVAVKIVEKDGKATPEVAWTNRQLTCYFSTPVAVDIEHLYMVTGTMAENPSVTLRCVVAATGEEVWNKPKVGKYHAALLRMGDGNLLMHDDVSGDLCLLAPNPKQYGELARSKACGPTWAHPAVANGMVFVRDNKELVALSLVERAADVSNEKVAVRLLPVFDYFVRVAKEDPERVTADNTAIVDALKKDVELQNVTKILVNEKALSNEELGDTIAFVWLGYRKKNKFGDGVIQISDVTDRLRKAVLVRFKSDPDKAKFKIDGVDCGETPKSLGLNRDEEYLITAVVDGHEQFERKDYSPKASDVVMMKMKKK